MTVTAEREESMAGFEDRNILPERYSCQILQEKTTLAAANDKSLPNDARLIFYTVNGVDYIDLVRCRKTVELFDMYYDAYGPGVVRKLTLVMVKSIQNSGVMNQRTKRKRNE